MSVALPRPAIIAHRGASAHAPENTLAAFRLAVKQGADAIELDVRYSKDRQIVVIHDETVDRTTNGTGRVATLLLEELKQLDAGLWFSQSFKNEPVPTLSEVFEAVGNDIIINIELKNKNTPLDDLPDRTAALTLDYEMTDRVIFSSFNPFALIRLNRTLPHAFKGLNTYRGWRGIWGWPWITPLVPHQAIHPHLRMVNASLIQRVHHQNRRIHPFTVNRAEDMRNLISQGVDGIISDEPLLARQVLGEFTQSPTSQA
jgi:glycerophosphoryl diester phosphodiesterase